MKKKSDLCREFSQKMDHAIKHVKLYISGKVQGVWYRESARRKALELGIRGFVCNQPDGTVYAEAEGDSMQVQRFIDWCKRGPELAIVQEVIAQEGAPKGFSGFEVVR